MKQHAGYVFEVLRAGEDYTLFRRRGPDQDCVLALAPSQRTPPPRSLDRLVHEHALAAELDSAWTAKPLELASHGGETMLLLEDRDDTPLDQLLQASRDHRLPLDTFLPLACELARAVHEVHARRLIHRDIKPANVLVDAAGRVRLTGFGMASRLPRERHPPGPPETIAGTLPYMAPEQTGRMNRSVDSRSDLYALGVTFYEMLTGALPFAASEPMEWIHCHVAREPTPPGERVPGVPVALESIVLKLLAKNAEDRYQRASALEGDLRSCLAQWAAHGAIAQLRPGARDLPDRLLIPEKLYGREAEIALLHAAFARVVKDGGSELVLISGYSGIGKSSLVSELHKAMVPPRGLFAAGKFDQYKRDIPHATLGQALQGLVRQLLGRKEEDLAPWREQLAAALGPNGQLMVNLIPELALVMGPQPPVPRVDPQDAAARFHMVFRSLLGVFARPEHPLVLFIDDLQWMDAGTLDMLQRIAMDPGIGHLLLIGAYRDNEVDAAHPLSATLDVIRRARPRLLELRLAPLKEANVAQLCADALRTDARKVAPLAAVVSEKTGGNPFFAIQFITELAQEDLLVLDAEAWAWKWDVSRIRAKGITDNVAHLMEAKLGRLSAETREALGQLACLGNVADLPALADLRGVSSGQVGETLREAVEAGLVLPVGSSLVFSHDRVHEAAYALVAPGERARTHLRIARVLMRSVPPEECDEKVFEIVNQFDRGAAAIEDAPERERVAELNLRAGKRAKTSGAYASARAYLAAAHALLGEDAAHAYRLAFDTDLHLAECEIALGKHGSAQRRLEALSQRAVDLPDRSAAACLTVLLCFTTGRYEQAVEVALAFLALVGVDWPMHPTETEVRDEYDEMHRQLADRAMEDLVGLPAMSDPQVIATMAVLTELFPAAYAVDRYLLELVLLRMANLSLRHGNHESSSVAYSALNMALGSHFSDYGTAYRLGQIACDLVDRRGMDRYKARVYCCFAAFAMPWVQPVSRCLALLRTSFRDSRSVGDAGFAAYTASNLLTHLLVSGQPLDQVEQEIERTLGFVQGVELGMDAGRFITHRELVRSLRGLPPEHRSADDAWASQDVELRPQLAMRVCYYWIFRLQERYFAGDFAAAVKAAAHVGNRLWTLRSTLEEAEYDFFAALAHAASAGSAAPAQREGHLQSLLEHHRRIAFWAGNCPDNFAHREALTGAEIARLQGRIPEAEGLFEQALQLAGKQGFVQCEAIASELAGQCHAARGLRTVADAYLLNARKCYERWGAVAKVRQLDGRYPHLRALAIPPSLAATISRPLAQLDVETVDKASQTLSSEVALPRLVGKLMRLAVEHSAAQRGLLILLHGREPRIEAEARTDAGRIDVDLRNAPAGPSDLPASALRYVLRTRERIVLDDASSAGLDPDDEYVRAIRPRSVLCLPVFKEAEVVGVLYLENNLATGAFTPERVAVLDFLGSQAAIALENARLYSDLRRSQAWLTEAQHLSLTGSFYWCVASEQVAFSEQAFRIHEFDPSATVTLGMIAGRFHPEDLALFHEMVELARGPAADLDFRYRVQMPDQSIKHLRLVAHATREPNGPLAYVGAIQDVSQSRRAEEALGKARSELAHVSRVTSLGALTASIAHEVNQPLTGIITNASTCVRMLAAGSGDLDGPRETLRRIIRDANRAADVIRRLRALFGKGASTCEPVDLNAAAREVIALSSTELQHARITLRAELSEEPPTVLGDRVQLQQVILNLLLNACEAMGPVVDRPRQLVIRTAAQAGEDVVVSVQDSGVGIDGDHADRLFEAFYSTKKDGMGIGLSVSRSIVESHGGRLWARPNDGPGATFAFSIPCQFGRADGRSGPATLRVTLTERPT